MGTDKAKGFGARGWILIIVLFLGFMSFQVFTNYPMNILSDFYGGVQSVAPLCTVGIMIGVVLQIILSAFVGKIKSIKRVTAIIGLIALIAAIGVAAIPVTIQGCQMLGLWKMCYVVVNIFITMYGLFFLSIVAGQWFPRRKGTVMGIATIAYPFANGVLGLFAGTAMAPLATGQGPAVLKAFLPFVILMVIGYVLFLAFVTDYPEQCGAYRDNDKSFTPELAKKMMEEEIENKRTTVWTTGHIFTNRDFWCAAVTCGLILMTAVGIMTQSSRVIGFFPELNLTIIMMIIAVFGAIGSWLLGVIDTAVGTKKSMLLATILMIVAGILGVLAVKTGLGVLIVIALILVAVFMGASSNYTVSVAAQYWRREDFAGVFACVNPIANIFNALAPTVVAFIITSKLEITGVFLFVIIAGIIATLLMLLFNGKHVKAVDDKYRQAAGKPIDNELADRK